MNRGLETGLILGSSKGTYSALNSGLTGMSMTNKLNMLDPSTITDPKVKPTFFINGDNVVLLSGTVLNMPNLTAKNTPGELLPWVSTAFEQTAGTSFRPAYLKNYLNGRAVLSFTPARYIIWSTLATSYAYASTTPSVSGTGMTYMFVIKRKDPVPGTIVDARDSAISNTTGDLLIEFDAQGRILFSYYGGDSGGATLISGRVGEPGAGICNDWSIVTVKCQLRKDGGEIPSDSSGPTIAKRYAMPVDNRIGSTSPINIYVNGVELQKTITANAFTNADFNNDDSFRILERQISIGNKGGAYVNGGSYIAAALLIPAYISNGMQKRIENYFRYYYNQPF